MFLKFASLTRARNSSASLRPKAPEVIGPAASGPIWRASASAATANPRLRSIGPYTLRISLPPAGSSTLCISRSEAGRSGKNCRPD